MNAISYIWFLGIIYTAGIDTISAPASLSLYIDDIHYNRQIQHLQGSLISGPQIPAPPHNHSESSRLTRNIKQPSDHLSLKGSGRAMARLDTRHIDLLPRLCLDHLDLSLLNLRRDY